MADLARRADFSPPVPPRSLSVEPSAHRDALPNCSDVELVRNLAQNGPAAGVAALEVLFERHGQPLLRFLTRVLRNQNEAEDLAHDAFLRVAETAKSYRGESPFRTWLFSIAFNLARSQQRRAAMKERAGGVLARRAGRAEPEDPAAAAQRREMLEKLDEAIALLAEPERETFLLYWFGELSYAEIEAMTGVTVAAAKVRVHRALARLSKMLADLR